MNLNNSKVHLAFSCPDNFPDKYIDNIIQDINAENLIVRSEKRQLEPFASLEWAIPGLIVAYVLKPYFESFLKEAGNDHFNRLKKWLKKIAITSRQTHVNTITSGQSTDKIITGYTQSKAFSFFVESETHGIIKLLFDNTLDDDVWGKNIDRLLELVKENHDFKEKSNLCFILNRVDAYKRKKTLYAIIDRETKDWGFFTSKDLVDKDVIEKMSGKPENLEILKKRRIQVIYQRLEENYTLLEQYEKSLTVEVEPKLKMKYKKEIEEIKESIMSFRQEYDNLYNELQG